MKKSILFTVSAVLGITAIVAVSVFVPPARSQIGNNPLIIQNVKTFNPNTAPSAPASFQQALLGTNKINNGNYVLYVGSMAYADNINFLFGTQSNGNQYSPNELASNYFLPLNGNFGEAINEQQTDKSAFAVQPEYLTYLNLVTPAEKEAEINYEAMVNNYKNQTITAGMSSEQIDNLQKQKTWANSAPTFSFAPGATYTNWQNKTVSFIQSGANTTFNNLVSFIASKFPQMEAISSSPGFVIGYHNGLPNTEFTPSYQKTKGQAAESFYTWLKANYGVA